MEDDYNIVLVSAIHKHESVIGIHMTLLLGPSFYLPPLPTPLGFHRAPDLGSLHHKENSHCLSILHVAMYMLHDTLSNYPTVCFLHHVPNSVLYVYISFAALKIGSSVLFFRFIYVLIDNIHFLFLNNSTLYSRL